MPRTRGGPSTAGVCGSPTQVPSCSDKSSWRNGTAASLRWMKADFLSRRTESHRSGQHEPQQSYADDSGEWQKTLSRLRQAVLFARGNSSPVRRAASRRTSTGATAGREKAAVEGQARIAAEVMDQGMPELSCSNSRAPKSMRLRSQLRRPIEDPAGSIQRRTTRRRPVMRGNQGRSNGLGGSIAIRTGEECV